MKVYDCDGIITLAYHKRMRIAANSKNEAIKIFNEKLEEIAQSIEGGKSPKLFGGYFSSLMDASSDFNVLDVEEVK